MILPTPDLPSALQSLSFIDPKITQFTAVHWVESLAKIGGGIL
jgi:hypothetical protein